MFVQQDHPATSKFSLSGGAFSPVKKTLSFPASSPSSSQSNSSRNPLPPNHKFEFTFSHDSLASKKASPEKITSYTNNGITTSDRPSSSILSAYETLLRTQRSQILELIDKNEQENKKWLTLSEEHHKLKEQSSSKILELETILSMTKLETEDRIHRTSNYYSTIMADQIRLKGLILDLSSRFSIESNTNTSSSSSSSNAHTAGLASAALARTSSSPSMMTGIGIGGTGVVGNYYQATRANNITQENQKLLVQISQSYQRLERSLYELFRIPAETSGTILSQETQDLFQTINQQNNQFQLLKNKLQQKRKKWKEEMMVLEKSFLTCKNDLAEATLQKEASKQEYEELRKETAAVIEDRNQWKQKASDAESKASDLTRKLSQIEHELHQTKLQHNTEQSRQGQLVNSLTENLQNTRDQLQQLKETYQMIEQQSQLQEKELHRTKEKLKQSQSSLQEKEIDNNERVRQFEAEIEKKHDYIHQLTVTIKKLKEEKQRDLQAFHHLQQQSQQEQQQHYHQQIQQLNEMKSSYESSYKTLQLEYDDFKLAYEVKQHSLQQKEKQLEQQIDFLQNTVYIQRNNSKTNKNNIPEQLQELKETNESISAQCRSQANQLEGLKEKYELLSTDFQTNQTDLERISRDKTNEKESFLQIIQFMIAQWEKFEQQSLQTLSNQVEGNIHSIILPRLDHLRQLIDTQSIPAVKREILEQKTKSLQQLQQFQANLKEEREEAEKNRIKLRNQAATRENQTRTTDQVIRTNEAIIATTNSTNSFSKDLFDQQIEQFSLTISSQKEQLQQLQDENYHFRSRVESLRSQLTEANSHLEGVKKSLDRMTAQRDQLQGTLQELQSKFDDSQAKLQLAASKEKELLDQSQSLFEEIEDIQNKSEVKLTTLLHEQDTLHRRLSEKDQQIEQLTELQQSLQEKNRTKNQVIVELHQKYTNLKQKLLSYKTFYQKQDNELFQKMGKFSDEMMSLQVQLNDLNTVVTNDSQSEVQMMGVNAEEMDLPPVDLNSIEGVDNFTEKNEPSSSTIREAHLRLLRQQYNSSHNSNNNNILILMKPLVRVES